MEGSSLSLESIHHIHSYSLPLDVLGDDVLQEHLEHSTGLLVDKSGDTFDSSPRCQTPDGKIYCEDVQVYYNN